MQSCLVVGDSDAVRTMARRIVEELNFQMEQAANAQAAFDSCSRALPDVILLDWEARVMQGIDFLRKLRKTIGGEGPIVVYCSTRSDIDTVQQALCTAIEQFAGVTSAMTIVVDIGTGDATVNLIRNLLFHSVNLGLRPVEMNRELSDISSEILTRLEDGGDPRTGQKVHEYWAKIAVFQGEEEKNVA